MICTGSGGAQKSFNIPARLFCVYKYVYSATLTASTAETFMSRRVWTVDNAAVMIRELLGSNLDLKTSYPDDCL
jgi:hypothetical protein